MKDSRYFPQAQLLVRYLPALAAADCFALKGGTAINLFVRDLPRLSVDIDLAYLPLSERTLALADTRAGLERVAKRAEELISGLRVQNVGTDDSQKQIASTPDAQIKIEPNPVLRGTVFPSEIRRLVPEAESLFEMSASVQVVSLADLYAGKLCAALDRQHPRDWFDVRLLLDNEGLSEPLRRAFVVYLACHPRPMAELLEPNSKPMGAVYESEFSGMTRDSVGLEVLENTQAELPKMLLSALTGGERRFLLSIKRGEPDWALLPIPHLSQLPALQWKLANIERLKRDSRKHAAAISRLSRVLGL